MWSPAARPDAIPSGFSGWSARKAPMWETAGSGLGVLLRKSGLSWGLKGQRPVA